MNILLVEKERNFYHSPAKNLLHRNRPYRCNLHKFFTASVDVSVIIFILLCRHIFSQYRVLCRHNW